MMELIKGTNIDFLKKRFHFFAISGTVMLIGIVSLLAKGLNFGLDFTGGSLLQIKFERKISILDMRKNLKASGVEPMIHEYSDNVFALKVKGAQEDVNEVAEKIISALETSFPKNKFTEEKRDFVGPVVGRDLTKKAIFAMILSLIGIIIYIAFRFSNPVWGTAGVVALAHDIFIVLTAFSLTGREIDLVIIAALLTIAGFSINDTIVIFDRMRENIKKFPKKPLKDLINLSINETLSRTIITSVTVFFCSASLFIFGGIVINDFAFAILLGTISGVYSTIAIASPLVYQWSKRR